MPSSSADCYDKKNKKTVQVKASSTGKNGKCNDLTSFGPKSEFDKLYFLDFYRKGKRDGKFDVYDIPIGFLYKTKVKKNMTLEQRAKKEGKRPRLSIMNKVIIPYNNKAKKRKNSGAKRLRYKTYDLFKSV